MLRLISKTDFTFLKILFSIVLSPKVFVCMCVCVSVDRWPVPSCAGHPTRQGDATDDLSYRSLRLPYTGI